MNQLRSGTKDSLAAAATYACGALGVYRLTLGRLPDGHWTGALVVACVAALIAAAPICWLGLNACLGRWWRLCVYAAFVGILSSLLIALALVVVPGTVRDLGSENIGESLAKAVLMTVVFGAAGSLFAIPASLALAVFLRLALRR